MPMEEAVIRKIPPHSVEAEQFVIGSMLMNKEAIAEASQIVHPEDFYQRQYGIMFEKLLDIYNRGQTPDLISLHEALKTTDLPPEVYSVDALRDILGMLAVSTDTQGHARTIYRKALLRKLIRTTEEIANECYAEKQDVDSILEMTERKIFNLLEKRLTTEFVPIRDIVVNVIDRIAEAAEAGGAILGLPTGFIDLDRQISGFQPSDLILIAARPSMGKTAFVLNIAKNLTMSPGKHYSVALFSLEMSKEQLVNRMLSMEAHVDSQAMRNGNLSPQDWGQIIESSDIIGNASLMIDDTPGISVSELRSKCRRYKLEHGLDCVMIDYLQLMSGSGRESRQQEISEISRSLKSLARELEVPVIALSQLSRAPEQRTDHRPMLADLRESGAIEQDADIVMFLYRDEYYNKDSASKGLAEVIVAKQRNGPIGTVELVWLANYCRFANKDYGPGPEE